jgi:protease-4
MNTHRIAFALLLLLVATGIAASPVLASDGDQGGGNTDKNSKPHIVRLTLKGSISDSGSADFSLLAGPQQGVTLRDVLSAIEKATADDTARGLVLDLKGPSLGWSQRDAVRRALLEYRASGKPSFCLLESGGLSELLLATACTEVSMVPSGSLQISGVSLQKIFFRGLLEKVGVRMQELRMGRYKSAVEAYTRDEPSEPVKEETNALLDHLYRDVVAALAENTGKKAVEVRALVDHGLFDPAEAKEAGLVHHVEYEDEMMARILGDGEIPVRSAKLKAGEEMKIEGFAGMMKLMNEIFSPKVEKESKNPKIAVIYATGAIDMGGGGSPLGGESIAARSMTKLFRKVREDDTVKGVVFRVNSPGGSALASDLIAREVALTAKAKPVVVSMGDLAASGGYYISAPASWIVAENATLTGSIGVIGGILDLSGTFEMAGVRIETYSRGKRADIVSPYGKLSDEGRELILDEMRRIYDTFLEIVAEGRDLPKEAVASIAEGRVWTGGQAFELGLVDQIGSLDDALAKVKEMAEAPADVEMMYLPKPKTFVDILMEMSGEDVRQGVVGAALGSLPDELRDILRRVGWVWILRRERVLAVMPDLYEIL